MLAPVPILPDLQQSDRSDWLAPYRQLDPPDAPLPDRATRARIWDGILTNDTHVDLGATLCALRVSTAVIPAR